MATAKRKYVPGAAIARNRMSIRDTAPIVPEHLTPVRIGVELAFMALKDGSFDRHCWDTLCEMLNIMTAIDVLWEWESNAMELEAANAAMRSVRERYRRTGMWLAQPSEGEHIRNAIAIYHKTITSITYNTLAAACTMVEKEVTLKGSQS